MSTATENEPGSIASAPALFNALLKNIPTEPNASAEVSLPELSHSNAAELAVRLPLPPEP